MGLDVTELEASAFESGSRLARLPREGAGKSVMNPVHKEPGGPDGITACCRQMGCIAEAANATVEQLQKMHSLACRSDRRHLLVSDRIVAGASSVVRVPSCASRDLELRQVPDSGKIGACRTGTPVSIVSYKWTSANLSQSSTKALAQVATAMDRGKGTPWGAQDRRGPQLRQGPGGKKSLWYRRYEEV